MSTEGQSRGSAPLRLLLDTNALIALEPFSGVIEPEMARAATIVRLSARQSHKVFVHPASRDELAEGPHQERARQRIAELAKFEMLVESPINTELRSSAGDSVADSNDHRDLRILASLHSGAVNFLVTDDAGLRRRANRAGLRDRVITVADAAAMLEGFEPSVATPPPSVETIPAYALDTEQAIFSSLRDDYPDFLGWMNKVRGDSEGRQCFVVTEPDGTYAAIAILKLNEDDCPYGLARPVTKLSTFKVDQPYAGSRYGELLLKAVLQSHADRHTASAYVEVLAKHDRLIDFMSQFGYAEINATTPRGEVVLAKQFRPRSMELPALDYHIRYGPPAVSPTAAVFVVPIQPRWHDQLFPECRPLPAPGDQLILPDFGQSKTFPWGNALRKAYLCNSATSTIKPGDALLFYRSGYKAVAVTGVVESTLRSASTDEVMNQVGGRTVYTKEDVTALASHQSQVLSILFRRDRLIEPQWSYDELVANHVLRGPPRTVMRVKEAGSRWVHDQLVDTH